MIRLFCIQTYHGHWACHSGYHRYLPHLEHRFRLEHRRIHRGKVDWAEIQGSERLLLQVLIGCAKKMANPWATPRDLLEEFRLFGEVQRALAKGESVVVHFMDGEVGYNVFGMFSKFLGRKRERLRLLATYHQPPSYLQKVLPWKRRAADLDLVLTVGTSQFSFFPFLPPGKLRFVPHGVDTGYFHPGAFQKVGDTIYCITVGHWLRDFETFEQVIRTCPRNIIFRIVAGKDHIGRFLKLNNVELYSGIDDDQLRSLYQSSDIGLMPLEDSTANNGLLEMMACGLPIIASQVGSVADYLPEEAGILLAEKSPEAFVAAVKQLADSPSQRCKLGKAARSRALELDWSNIASQMAEVYSQA